MANFFARDNIALDMVSRAQVMSMLRKEVAREKVSGSGLVGGMPRMAAMAGMGRVGGCQGCMCPAAMGYGIWPPSQQREALKILREDPAEAKREFELAAAQLAAELPPGSKKRIGKAAIRERVLRNFGANVTGYPEEWQYIEPAEWKARNKALKAERAAAKLAALEALEPEAAEAARAKMALAEAKKQERLAALKARRQAAAVPRKAWNARSSAKVDEMWQTLDAYRKRCKISAARWRAMSDEERAALALECFGAA